MPRQLNRQPCGRLQNRTLAAQECKCKYQRPEGRKFTKGLNMKLGAEACRKPPLGYPRRGGNRVDRWQRITTAKARVRFVTTKARPHENAAKQRCCGCTHMDKPHESAIHSPGRQELQNVSVDSCTRHTGTSGSRAPGLARSGRAGIGCLSIFPVL